MHFKSLGLIFFDINTHEARKANDGDMGCFAATATESAIIITAMPLVAAHPGHEVNGISEVNS